MPGRPPVLTFALAVAATGLVGFLGANHTSDPWSVVLVTPWALVLSGIVFVAMFDEDLLAAEARWVSLASHVLAGGTVAFVVHEALIRSSRHVLAWPLNGVETGLAVLAVALLGGLAFAVGLALRRRGATERRFVAGVAGILVLAGGIPGLALVPALTVVVLQIVLLVPLLGLSLETRDVVKAGAQGGAVLVVGLAGLMLGYGELFPPKLSLDAALATRWLYPMLAVAAIVVSASLVLASSGEDGEAAR